MALHHYPRIVTDGLIYYLDFANPRTGPFQSPVNLMPYPTDNYSWCGTAGTNNCTISRDTISSPVGNTPLKMVVTGVHDPYIDTYGEVEWNIGEVNEGEIVKFTVYAKSSTPLTGQLFIFGSRAYTGIYPAGGYNSTPINITTDWKQFSMELIMAAGRSITNVQVRIDGGGDVDDIIWWDGFVVTKTTGIQDLSGNNNGAKQGTPTSSPLGGGSLHFDGSYDKINLGRADEFIDLPIENESRTIAAWFRADNDATGQNGIMGWGGSANSGQAWGLIIDYAPNGGIRLATYGNDIGLSEGIYDDKWHYAVGIHDSTINTRELYLDGISRGTDESVIDTTIDVFPHVWVGDWISASSFKGYISTVAIYNRVITNDEQLQNYNALKWRFQ